MARDDVVEKGGRTVLLRSDVVASLDSLASAVGLVAVRGKTRGKPDRVGVIEAAAALILGDPELVESLRHAVSGRALAARQRPGLKVARARGSGGKPGRPRKSPAPALSFSVSREDAVVRSFSSRRLRQRLRLTRVLARE
jgi:hypothetical protein